MTLFPSLPYPSLLVSSLTLIQAAGSGRLGVVELLLTRAEVRPDTVDICNRTPLHWAINWEYDDDDDEEFEGSYIYRNIKPSPREEGTLIEIIKILLAHGANPDSKDNNHRTPLTIAIERQRYEFAKLLLDTGKIDLTWKDKEGRTPLMWAKLMKDKEIVDLLQKP